MSRVHVYRPAPPWRSDPGLSVCGRDSARVDVITVDALLSWAGSIGRDKIAESMCRTCLATVRAYPGWAENPAAMLAREVDDARDAHQQWAATRPEPWICVELRAIADLIAAHPEEFDGLVAARAKTRMRPEYEARRLLGEIAWENRRWRVYESASAEHLLFELIGSAHRTASLKALLRPEIRERVAAIGGG